MGKNAPVLNLLILLALLAGACGPGASGSTGFGQGAAAGILAPQLAALAAEEPLAQVRVIVQKTGDDREAEQLAASLGAEMLHDLDWINAFAIRIPAGKLAALAQGASVVRISPDAPVRSTGTGSESPHITLRADFDRTRYADELSGWPSAWQEIGEANGPQAGRVVIEGFMAGLYRGVRLMGDGAGIQSRVDLSRARGAVLSLAFRRKDFAEADRVALEISPDGAGWSTIDVFSGPALDPDLVTRQYDLGGDLGEVYLRLAGDLSGDARFYLDFLQVDYATTPKAPPDMPFKINLPFMAGPPVQDDPAAGAVQALAALYASGTVLDRFDAVAYTNNNGLIPWSGPWIENDPAGPGPSAGSVLVASGELRLSDNPYSGALPGIERAVDLSGGVTGAVLSFTFRATGVDAYQDRIAVEVSAGGGTIYHTLEVLESFAGSLEGSRRYDISAFTGGLTRVRFRVLEGYSEASEYFYLKDVAIAYTTTGAQTVRDEFNLTAYDNQDGIASWNGSWIEYDPDGGSGPYGGYVSVSNSRLRFYWTWYEYILRQVDLSGATRATLTFDWETAGLDANEAITVLVSPGDGAPYTELGAFTGTQKGSAVYDLTPFISPHTTLRFDNLDEDWDYGEYAFFDNLQIAFASPCPECIDASALEGAWIPAVGANKLWNEPPYLQGQDVTVAVVDSGVADLPDFLDPTGSSRILTHVSFAGETELPDDFYGHGTHIAGLIAGNGATSGGAYLGIAPRSNLVDVKVLNDLGMGYTSDVVAGLEWLYKNAETYNVRVVNLSLNSALEESYRTNALSAALEMLWFRGVTVVVATGNNQAGADAGVLFPPANDPYLIAVGAVDDHGTAMAADDTLADFSAYGWTLEEHSRPDLVAPGVNMVSLAAGDDSNLIINHPEYVVVAPNGSKLFRMSGTSTAAPVAAAAAALLLQAEPTLNPDQVKARLVASARPLSTGNGAGIVNVYEAVHSAVLPTGQQDYLPNEILAKMALIAYWASAGGEQAMDWESVDWTGVDWESVDWESVDWEGVDWSAVDWAAVNWGSVNWGSVNWGSVNWGSVNWGTVNWGSVNWGSDYWEELP